MEINHKKTLKLIVLLLSSLLIATVSAQAYRFMYIGGTVTITSGTGLGWVKGDEASPGTSISGSTATVALSIDNGTIANFTHYLYLQELNSSTHSLVINITDAADTNLYEANGFNMTICDNSSQTLIDTLDVLTTDSYSGNIDADAKWHIIFEVATKTDATGSDSFDIQFRYE
jgi:hypothetical protein